MRVRFWGTRGSIPVALTGRDVRDRLAQALVLAANGRHASTAIEKAHAFVEHDLDFSLTHTFGGHSSCVEFEMPARAEYFVCDMGSGARPFGAHVLARQSGRPATVNIFMSHVHWDHIMGFPFFGPAYVPRHAHPHPRLPSTSSSTRSACSRTPPCFPVPFEQLAREDRVRPSRARRDARDRRRQGHAAPAAAFGDSYGFRFEHDGKSFVYTTDSEHKLEDRRETERFVASSATPTW